MAVATSLAFFFLAWGILHDLGDETPWVTSGVGASIVLACAVLVRELVLRRARDRYLRMQPATTPMSKSSLSSRDTGKLTLEKNAAILAEIRQKSDAAKVLSKFSAGHREVFELCGGYLARNEAELTTVNAGSPRLAALLKGRKAASKYHRHHLLKWAEIEARALTTVAKSGDDVSQKLRAAKDALGVIEFALQAYPAETTLLESRDVVNEMAVSIRVSDLVERAERAAFRRDDQEAVSLYRDALFYLGRDNVHTPERRAVADRINAEMEKLRLPDGGE
jgi:hypothetical protein